MEFKDRHVIVTGGAGALGRAVTAALLAGGAVCHVPVRRAASADRQEGLTQYPDLDVGDPEQVARLFAAVPQVWASIHLAGGFAAGALAAADIGVLRGQIETNLMSCLLCCRAAAQAMAGRGGRIVNVAARPALEWRQGAGMAAYAAAKAGVAALTTALAEEVAGEDILVNAVAPSVIDTPANRAAMPGADHAKWPKPRDVAATILFLASPDNRATRGAIVPVYGRA